MSSPYINVHTVHRIDDIDLAAAIAAQMQILVDVRGRITIDVSNAVVTLEGEAENSQQREAAEALVRGFRGVAGVVNAIALTRRYA